MYIHPAGDPSPKAHRHQRLRRDRRRWYFVCPRCDAKWFALVRETLCPRCCARGRSRERLTPPWWSGSAGTQSPSQIGPIRPPNSNLNPMEDVMPDRRPIHEIRLGAIRAAVWANQNRTHGVWFGVTRFKSVGSCNSDVKGQEPLRDDCSFGCDNRFRCIRI